MNAGRTAVKYQHDGVERTISEWAEHLGLTIEAMRKRIHKWPAHRAFSPKRKVHVIHGDLTGKRFGKLVVLERVGVRTGNQPAWLTQCDCGYQHTATCYGLVTGSTTSCGCARNQTPTLKGAWRG